MFGLRVHERLLGPPVDERSLGNPSCQEEVPWSLPSDLAKESFRAQPGVVASNPPSVVSNYVVARDPDVDQPGLAWLEPCQERHFRAALGFLEFFFAAHLPRWRLFRLG